MALAALANVPGTEHELNMWAFCHMAHHRDVIARIFDLGHIALEEFILDPFDPDNSGGWSYQHQAMHTQVNAVLGTSGFDLTDPDWKNTSNLAGWIQSNLSDHRQWADILGVG